MQQARRLRILVLIAGVLGASAHGAFAQSYAGAPVMQDPISIRASSMGLTGAADNSDPDNIWFNPANAVGKHGVYVDHGRWETNPFFIESLPFTRWSAGGTFGVGNNFDLGVNATYGQLDYGTYTVTGLDGSTLGQVDTWERYATVTVAAMTRVKDRVDVRVGAGGTHYWADYGPVSFTESLGEDVTSDGFAIDLGIAAAMPVEYEGWMLTPAIGFAYVNFGSDIDIDLGQTVETDPFPTRLHYGSSVRVDGPGRYQLYLEF